MDYYFDVITWEQADGLYDQLGEPRPTARKIIEQERKGREGEVRQ